MGCETFYCSCGQDFAQWARNSFGLDKIEF